MKNNPFMVFLGNLFKAVGDLLVKLAGSRKSFFQLVSKATTLYLILTLIDGWQIITVFGISTIADFVYFNEINFEKVKTDISLGNK